jgi:hypothetical protein
MAAEPATAKDMVAAMAKCARAPPCCCLGISRLTRAAGIGRSGDGTNILAETRKTFGMAGGKNLKGDVSHPAKDIKGALSILKTMVETAKGKAKAKKLQMWEFGSSPHAQFGKSLDDTFVCFLMWARISGDDDEEEDEADSGAASGQINVSKAFRRLESYADWMEDTGTELTEPPLVFDDDMALAHKTWGMSTSIAASGELVWWIDLAQLDTAAVKTTPVELTFRYFVWYAHAVMYNANAQEHGMAFCESIGNMGFWPMMTMVPMKLSAKLDRLTIGTLPVKMSAPQPSRAIRPRRHKRPWFPTPPRPRTVTACSRLASAAPLTLTRACARGPRRRVHHDARYAQVDGRTDDNHGRLHVQEDEAAHDGAQEARLLGGARRAVGLRVRPGGLCRVRRRGERRPGDAAREEAEEVKL